MKNSVISDFQKLLKRLNVGYQDDYQKILTKITFIETASELKNPYSIYEKLLSYE
jgi:hypothetical protein